MHKQGLLPCSIKHACHLLSQDNHADKTGLEKRLKTAPKNTYLAVDIFVSKHQGWKIQGLDKYYNTSDKGTVWGLGFADATLIWADKQKDPYPLCIKGYLYEKMATKEYPSLKPSELMLSLTRKIDKALEIKAVTFDGGITARSALKKLKVREMAFVGRIGTRNNVIYEGKEIGIKKLAEGFTPGKIRWYKKFECYAKRIKVKLVDVGEIDLVIIWWRKREDYKLSVLVSTLKEGIREDTVYMLSGFGVLSQGLTNIYGKGACMAEILEDYADAISGNMAMHETFVKVTRKGA